MYNRIDTHSKNYHPEKAPDYLIKILEMINSTNNVKALTIIRKGIYSELTTFGMIIHNYEMIIDSKDFDDECYEKYKLDCSEYFVRKLIREQKICGVYCGHGFRVTKKSLLNYLEGGAA